MIKRFFASFCWIVLVALALPSQALSYLTKCTSAASQPLTHNTSYDPTVDSVGSSPIFTKSSEIDGPNTPVSKSGVDADLLATGQFVRLSSLTRDGNDTKQDFPFDGDSFDKSSPSITTDTLFSSSPINHWSGFHSQYRISGWKESNALYVALNGHFS
ncbi:hypothetical protein MHN79_15405 [Vibrio sp. Of14-4]|uniref:hypothetical protein n=1 Tax=Vibrio sp. Of14-4 TaxID=2724878 RepID=UPI001EF3392F|nr:hypothetical protein [Vibrio sp. Of14-4]MCG7490877.1 hypothetical protein [Vibrio sp. Of14-4]